MASSYMDNNWNFLSYAIVFKELTTLRCFCYPTLLYIVCCINAYMYTLNHNANTTCVSCLIKNMTLIHDFVLLIN
jgi:hypothetical protein